MTTYDEIQSLFRVIYCSRSLTSPSIWIHVKGISASMSMAFDIEAGMASYVGAAGVEAAWGAGREAASAAAMEVAAIFQL